MNDEPIFPDIAKMDEAFGCVRIRQAFPVRDTEYFMDFRPNTAADETQGTDE